MAHIVHHFLTSAGYPIVQVSRCTEQRVRIELSHALPLEQDVVETILFQPCIQFYSRCVHASVYLLDPFHHSTPTKHKFSIGLLLLRQLCYTVVKGTYKRLFLNLLQQSLPLCFIQGLAQSRTFAGGNFYQFEECLHISYISYSVRFRVHTIG